MMTNCYTYLPDSGETFSEQQIIEISKSISEAVEKELLEQSKILSIDNNVRIHREVVQKS